MAFSSQNLSVLAYANGFTLWHYKSNPDAATTIDTTGYFNSAANLLRVGDMIMANTATGSTRIDGIFIVTSNTGSVVDVANINQLNNTNTD